MCLTILVGNAEIPRVTERAKKVWDPATLIQPAWGFEPRWTGFREKRPLFTLDCVNNCAPFAEPLVARSALKSMRLN